MLQLLPQSSENITVMPVIPVRDLIVFPGIVSPLFVSRSKSVHAVEEAAERDRRIFIVAEKSPSAETPTSESLYSVGTVCKILQNLHLPDGVLKVVAEGVCRARIVKISGEGSYMLASVKPLEQEVATAHADFSPEVRALMRSVMREFEINVTLDPKLPDEIYNSVREIKEASTLSDVVASHCRLEIEKKQKLLETPDAGERLELLLGMLISENEILGLERQIEEKVRSELEKEQHNYYLREKLKVINRELGEEGPANEAEEMKKAAAAAGMPDDILERVNKEITRFAKLQQFSPEAAVARSYIETLNDLPWKKSTEDCLDIGNARRVLEEDHYGLEDAKKRILEYLAVKSRAGSKTRGQVICFAGPPGVGKTSLGRSIARAMGRKFINISLGGMRDEAEIRGHRRTYVGALPGRIIQKIKQCGVNNPLILMDEVDKLGSDFRGDPSSALLEALDPEQNWHFVDNFLEVPFDLSRVMFITTANNTATIPKPLLDRMEVIQLPGYVLEEKMNIAKRHLLPRIRAEHGLENDEMKISDAALKEIISSYTLEAGVRGLDRELSKIARKRAVELSEGKEITPLRKSRLKDIIGAPKLHGTDIPRHNTAGTAIGLAWTEAGGDVILIESAAMDGSGKVTYTGNLGGIMQESASNALAYLRSHAADYSISDFDWNKKDIHIHVPAGAVPKDGPSAGITLALSLVSTLSGKKVNTKYAMTGEMTLHGKVLPIGGVREKILAAKRHGIKDIILPETNRADISELSGYIPDGLQLHFVSDISEVFALALGE